MVFVSARCAPLVCGYALTIRIDDGYRFPQPILRGTNRVYGVACVGAQFIAPGVAVGGGQDVKMGVMNHTPYMSGAFGDAF